MSKTRKILVATDFSVRARHAGEVAIEWARSIGADLHWAHCTEGLPKGVKPSAVPLLSNYVERARTYALREMEQSVRDARTAGVAGDSHLLEGDPVETLAELSDEIGAELFVTGSHGHTGLKRAWLGSVAEGLVREADCSVLVTRGHVSPLGKATILVGDDLTPESGAARKAALEIAASSGAPIEFVHSLDLGIFYLSNLEVVVPAKVFTSAYDEASARLAAASADCGDAKIENRVVGERPIDAICERAEEIGAGLVVVGAHSREGLDRVLLGSVARRVVRSAPCSVLVARAR